jgi:NADPH:quinone reductase-like Zn-dependent oxidoreductase
VFANPEVVQPVFDQIIAWAEAGALRSEPDATYPLERAGDAFAALFGRTSTGKILIRC